MSESGSFEQDMASDASYLTSPSAKRARYEDTANLDEVAQVTEVETVEEDAMPSEVDHTVTITVPSSQFEIEINSQNDTGSPTEIGTIQTGDLSGPAFGIVHETQEISLTEPQLGPEGAIGAEDGGTLNAIGRALIQMQQGGQSIAAGTAPGVPQSQLIFTRATSTDSDTVAPNGSGNAPLYVMIPPASSAEILQAMGQSRPIAPKSTVVATADLSNTDVATADSMRKNREAQRKATHNEVERRRRDRINELIKVLAQVVPGCQKKDATTGNVVGYVYSKGTVLDKTVEYLKELMGQNEQLAATAKLAEKSASALSVLQNQIAVLEKENAFLRAQIIQFGIDAAASGSQTSGGNRQLLNSPLAQSLLNSVSQSPQVASAITINNPVGTTSPNTAPLSSPGGGTAGVGPQQQNSTQLAAQQLLISLAQSLTNSPLLTSQTPSSGSSPSPLAQAVSTSPPSLHLTSAAPGTTPNIPGPVAPGTPSRLHPSQLNSSTTSTPSTPQQLTQPSQPTPPPPQPHPQPQSLLTTALATSNGSGALPSTAISLPSTAPVLGSLVQTLASLAGTNTTASPNPPLPKAATNSIAALPPSLVSANLSPAQLPQTTGVPPSSGTTGGLSAAAAASLLNTLILAQNVLTGGGASPAGVGMANPGSGGGVVLGDSSSVLSGIGLEAVATGEHTTPQ